MACLQVNTYYRNCNHYKAELYFDVDVIAFNIINFICHEVVVVVLFFFFFFLIIAKPPQNCTYFLFCLKGPNLHLTYELNRIYEAPFGEIDIFYCLCFKFKTRY